MGSYKSHREYAHWNALPRRACYFILYDVVANHLQAEGVIVDVVRGLHAPIRQQWPPRGIWGCQRARMPCLDETNIISSSCTMRYMALLCLSMPIKKHFICQSHDIFKMSMSRRHSKQPYQKVKSCDDWFTARHEIASLSAGRQMTRRHINCISSSRRDDIRDAAQLKSTDVAQYLKIGPAGEHRIWLFDLRPRSHGSIRAPQPRMRRQELHCRLIMACPHIFFSMTIYYLREVEMMARWALRHYATFKQISVRISKDASASASPLAR